jgi:hypothetical protein
MHQEFQGSLQALWRGVPALLHHLATAGGTKEKDLKCYKKAERRVCLKGLVEMAKEGYDPLGLRGD